MTVSETKVGTAALPRMMSCFINQKKRALVCPPLGDLRGRIIGVTGATNGIGFETTNALIEAGAMLLLFVRNETKAGEMLQTFGNPKNAAVIPLDLSDLRTIEPAIAACKTTLRDRSIDTLIENAGVSPQSYKATAQGHEIAFGTNVLGHFALRQSLLNHDLLTNSARLVVVTGDIYILAKECTADYKYRTPLGGSLAYSRSKLGNIWIAKECGERNPELQMTLVHPGVVNSGLMMGDSPVERVMKKALLPTHLGAQTSLFCATQTVLPGGYYHNTRGLMQLSPSDPAMEEEKRKTLWQQCEALVAPFLEQRSARSAGRDVA